MKITKTETNLLNKSTRRNHQVCGVETASWVSGANHYRYGEREANALRALVAKGLAAIVSTDKVVLPKHNAATVFGTEFAYRLTPAGIEFVETNV